MDRAGQDRRRRYTIKRQVSFRFTCSIVQRVDKGPSELTEKVRVANKPKPPCPLEAPMRQPST
mgnify:CR=1 FL=1